MNFTELLTNLISVFNGYATILYVKPIELKASARKQGLKFYKKSRIKIQRRDYAAFIEREAGKQNSEFVLPSTSRPDYTKKINGALYSHKNDDGRLYMKAAESKVLESKYFDGEGNEVNYMLDIFPYLTPSAQRTAKEKYENSVKQIELGTDLKQRTYKVENIVAMNANGKKLKHFKSF